MITAQSTTPGEAILELLTIRGVSIESLASMVAQSSGDIGRIIRGDLPITPPIAIKLDSLFGVPASFWLSLND